MINIFESKSIKSVGNTSLKVSFDYNKKIVDIVKSADGAIWLNKLKIWEVPLTSLAYLVDNLTYIDDINIEPLQDIDNTKRLGLTLNYKTTPFKYQLEGVEWLINHPNSLILDEPGLGKTLQLIYAAEELKAQKGAEHCLIICGINTLKSNWEKEILRHSNLTCRIIGKRINSKGTVSYASVSDRAEELYNKLDEFFIIINVESLRDRQVLDAIRDSKNKFDIIAFDEVHKAKSATSATGKNLLKLAKVGKYHYGMTGTVLVNSPIDAFVPLKFIGEESGTYTNFKEFYCVYENKFGHNQIVGYKNLDILKSEISNCSIRRMKNLLDLPPKVIVPEFIEMSPQHLKFYNDIKSGVIEEADRVNIKTSSLLGLVTRLRQASTCPSVLTSSEFVNAKIDRACDIIDEVVSNGEKIVVFSSFKEPLYILKDMLEKYNPLLGTGDIPDLEVSDNIDKFQNDDKYKVMLCTTQKMGTGITLTAASYEIFLDSAWTQALESQCEDRCWRIGATKPVIIYKLISEGTIDERVQTILNRKRAISDYIIDDKSVEADELRELLGI